MKSYSFVIKFKDEIGFFSQSQVVSDIRDLISFNGFVLGKNVKKIKKIQVNGDEVKVSVSLLFDKNEKELEEAVNDIKSGLKKRKYKLINKDSKSLEKKGGNTKKIRKNKNQKRNNKSKKK